MGQPPPYLLCAIYFHALLHALLLLLLLLLHALPLHSPLPLILRAVQAVLAPPTDPSAAGLMVLAAERFTHTPEPRYQASRSHASDTRQPSGPTDQSMFWEHRARVGPGLAISAKACQSRLVTPTALHGLSLPRPGPLPGCCHCRSCPAGPYRRPSGPPPLCPRLAPASRESGRGREQPTGIREKDTGIAIGYE